MVCAYLGSSVPIKGTLIQLDVAPIYCDASSLQAQSKTGQRCSPMGALGCWVQAVARTPYWRGQAQVVHERESKGTREKLSHRGVGDRFIVTERIRVPAQARVDARVVVSESLNGALGC